jgi:hypothetical protein
VHSNTPRFGTEREWFEIIGRITHVKLEPDGDFANLTYSRRGRGWRSKAIEQLAAYVEWIRGEFDRRRLALEGGPDTRSSSPVAPLSRD